MIIIALIMLLFSEPAKYFENVRHPLHFSISALLSEGGEL